MDVSTPPSLDLACPQAEADNEKYVHMFRDRGVKLPETIISVIEAIAIYNNIGKSRCKSFSASPHTQLSFSLSQLLTLTQYLWVWSFNRTQRNIGAYSFASQRFTSRVMSTIIVYDNLHPIGYIYQDLSNTMCLPKDKM